MSQSRTDEKTLLIHLDAVLNHAKALTVNIDTFKIHKPELIKDLISEMQSAVARIESESKKHADYSGIKKWLIEKKSEIDGLKGTLQDLKYFEASPKPKPVAPVSKQADAAKPEPKPAASTPADIFKKALERGQKARGQLLNPVSREEMEQIVRMGEPQKDQGKTPGPPKLKR